MEENSRRELEKLAMAAGRPAGRQQTDQNPQPEESQKEGWQGGATRRQDDRWSYHADQGEKPCGKGPRARGVLAQGEPRRRKQHRNRQKAAELRRSGRKNFWDDS